MTAVCAEILGPPPTAPAQHAIGWGDHFARIDRAACAVEFGRVVTEDVLEAEPWADSGYDNGWREVVIAGHDGSRRRQRVHVSGLSPLTAEQYETASAAGFSTGELGRTSGGRRVLVAVFTDPRWEGDRT